MKSFFDDDKMTKKRYHRNKKYTFSRKWIWNLSEWVFFFVQDYTHLTNMLIPVGSIARLIAFHDATIVHFWRAVSGSRSSVAAGAGGSLTLLSTFFLSPLLANLPNSHPMIIYLVYIYTQNYDTFSIFFVFFYSLTKYNISESEFSHLFLFMSRFLLI